VYEKNVTKRYSQKPGFCHVRKGTAFEGCAWLFGQQREAERKREEKFEGGENMFRKFSLS
jgi:hypothetical protein